MMKRIFSGIILAGLVGVSFGPTRAFAAVHTAGTNVVSNGTIYMITTDNQRRPYTSAGAYLSYGFNNWGIVQQATAEDLALPEGSFIPPRDGKIVCSDRGSDKGTCYLITNGKRAAFVSAKVFTGLGFSFSKAIYGDVSFMSQESDVASSGEQHRTGVLIKRNGTVYLVAGGALMGIPSMDVLGTWGYSLADVVNANANDASLSQNVVIQARQGSQLSPAGDAASNISEDVLLQSYVDTHPALPTTEVTDQAAAAEVIAFDALITPKTASDLYPYLSARSLELLNRSPQFKALLETSESTTLGLTYVYPKVTIYQGSTTALYSATASQAYTGYTRPAAAVYVKENGSWKLDLIGTIKYEQRQYQLRNPSNAFVTGSGTTDLTIVSLDYYNEPRVNDNSNRVLVEVKNKGQTSIQKFLVYIEVNDAEVYQDIVTEQLAPGQSILLAFPISAYWTFPSVSKMPGMYRTTVSAGMLPANLESNLSDNAFYFDTVFK